MIYLLYYYIYYLEKVTYSKFRFSMFKKFVSRLVFGEIELTQISLKARGVGTKLCVAFLLLLLLLLLLLFLFFFFENSYHTLKSKIPCFLLNKNITFNKSKSQSKLENLTQSFREVNLGLQLV